MSLYCSQKQGIIKKEVQEEEKDERRHWGVGISVEGLWLADTLVFLPGFSSLS